MLLIVLATIVSIFLYRFLLKPHKYWRNRNINYDAPVVLFGSMWENARQRLSFAEVIEKLYRNGNGERYYGCYAFLRPILMIRDLDLIKKLGIKEFDSFVDHQSFTADDIDPLFSRSLIALTGQTWRDMRPVLSPAFTSNKMKAMFHLMSDVAEQFTKHFVNKNVDAVSAEMKQVFTRFTADAIATCAFGLHCDSLEEPENEFYMQGKEATDFGGLKAFRFFLYQISPAIMKFFKIKIFSEKTSKFFTDLVLNTIRSREQAGIIRPDMIHLLIEAKKGRLVHDVAQSTTGDSFAAAEESQLGKTRSKTKLTETDLVSQGLIFFVAGYESSATLITYMAYELAINTDVQDRLRDEIEETYAQCGGKLTYEALMKMKYLDMVVSETLRKWPPTAVTDRVCTKDYVIERERYEEIAQKIDKGTALWIPIFAIHRDETHYPEPLKFDPDRFSDENRSKIHPASFIPFGIGPRNCIGSRFALMESKILMFHLLRDLKIVPVAKTLIPIKLDPKALTMGVSGGMWLGFKRNVNAK